jgi:carboxylesterase
MSPQKNIYPPAPLRTFAEAQSALQDWLAEDDEQVHPDFRHKLYSHGARTEHAAVLFHGYTHSSPQYRLLAPRLFDLGWNVFVPRAPHHGHRDPLTTATTHLTAAGLARFTSRAVDLAAGLGAQVAVAGLSMGGVLAAWAAQQRSDVSTALIISPAFGARAIPTRFTDPVTRLVSLAPDSFRWWNAHKKAPEFWLPTAYPQYSMHGLAQIIRLGAETRAEARRTPPRAGRVVMVTNANDFAVNNELNDQVVAAWRRAGAANLSTYQFPADLQLGHDLIEPTDLGANLDLVYSVLIDLLVGKPAPRP